MNEGKLYRKIKKMEANKFRFAKVDNDLKRVVQDMVNMNRERDAVDMLQSLDEAAKDFRSLLEIDWDAWTLEGAKRFASIDKECKLIYTILKWFGDAERIE